jgi:hypothetical protein
VLELYMFKIIKDPDTASQYAAAGLLWWVSEEDGGEQVYIVTCDITPDDSGPYVIEYAPKGVFGILLED